MIEHKVVELMNVTDADLTAALNTAAADGWSLERVDYVRESGIRRPQMAFLFFVRPKGDLASD
jgi:hypothetical protein